MGKNNSRQSTGIQRSAVVSDANHQWTFKITPRNKIEIPTNSYGSNFTEIMKSFQQ
jgi:hypothetical protein